MSNAIRNLRITNEDSLNFRNKLRCYVSSGTSGGTVVSQVSPSASLQAGQDEVNAANEASQDAAQSIGAAINSINAQYQTATAALQPAQQVGVQALDKLNQYLQLNPYNPGSAPVAPTAPTLASEEAGISHQDLLNYVTQNSTLGTSSQGGVGNMHYTGIGSGNEGSGAGSDYTYDGPQAFIDSFGDQIKQSLATDELNNPNSESNLVYGVDQQAYQTQMNQYTPAENYYQQYSAEGPLSSTQIANNIENLPGYQAQLQQGTQEINADAAAKGYLGSGQMLKELDQFGQNTFSQFYGNTLSQLAGLAGAGQSAATSLASEATNQGNSLANLFTTLGNDQGNAALAAGSAEAQALTAANTSYGIVPGSQSSSNSVNLSGIGSLISAFAGGS